MVGMVAMDYSREVEESLAPAALLEWAWKVRDNIRQHKLRRIMSTRTIIDLAKMTEVYDWKLDDWRTSYYADWSSEERRVVNA